MAVSIWPALWEVNWISAEDFRKDDYFFSEEAYILISTNIIDADLLLGADWKQIT